jgi:hypothetical protein
MARRKLPAVPAKSRERTIAEAVAWLQEKKEGMEAELTLRAKEIGDYLIRQFFHGDLALVASQNPHKDISFRKLCARADLPFPESALRRFIQVAVNFHFLPPDKARALPPSHHSLLYQVADPDERRRLGVAAAEREVSVRRLREMVKGKGKRRPGAGRKRHSPFFKSWRQLNKALTDLVAACEEGALPEAERWPEVRQQTRELRDRLNQVIDHLMDLPPAKKDDEH